MHIDPKLFLSETPGDNNTDAATKADTWRNGKVEGRRLVIQHADDVANLTWAGQSYETNNVQPSGRLVVEEIEVAQGFDLRSTEAILISFP